MQSMTPENGKQEQKNGSLGRGNINSASLKRKLEHSIKEIFDGVGKKADSYKERAARALAIMKVLRGSGIGWEKSEQETGSPLDAKLFLYLAQNPTASSLKKASAEKLEEILLEQARRNTIDPDNPYCAPESAFGIVVLHPKQVGAEKHILNYYITARNELLLVDTVTGSVSASFAWWDFTAAFWHEIDPPYGFLPDKTEQQFAGGIFDFAHVIPVDASGRFIMDGHRFEYYDDAEEEEQDEEELTTTARKRGREEKESSPVSAKYKKTKKVNNNASSSESDNEHISVKLNALKSALVQLDANAVEKILKETKGDSDARIFIFNTLNQRANIPGFPKHITPFQFLAVANKNIAPGEHEKSMTMAKTVFDHLTIEEFIELMEKRCEVGEYADLRAIDMATGPIAEIMIDKMQKSGMSAKIISGFIASKRSRSGPAISVQLAIKNKDAKKLRLVLSYLSLESRKAACLARKGEGKRSEKVDAWDLAVSSPACFLVLVEETSLPEKEIFKTLRYGEPSYLAQLLVNAQEDQDRLVLVTLLKKLSEPHLTELMGEVLSSEDPEQLRSMSQLKKLLANSFEKTRGSSVSSSYSTVSQVLTHNHSSQLTPTSFASSAEIEELPLSPLKKSERNIPNLGNGLSSAPAFVPSLSARR